MPDINEQLEEQDCERCGHRLGDHVSVDAEFRRQFENDVLLDALLVAVNTAIELINAAHRDPESQRRLKEMLSAKSKK